MEGRLEQEVFHVIRRLMHEHTARWQQMLPDLTKPQYAVLSAIAERPGIEQMRLVDAAASSKATLAEMLNRLEERGIIVRRQDDIDRRRRFVHLTEAGQAMLTTAQPFARQTDEVFLNRLLPSERKNLQRLLGLMLVP
ncbi:MarR family winged helix-turn-helix transcriptional regulator [Telmatospirillum siberiense]|uniref:Transcriptional regulator n=1 Tax=Telmatospirillum siberiense TaxID=382514 RepID=A0A2N3PUH0_9PROT|nr:MarR family winged helix-turn-helix transcriptional regulator [Telmatospirillum siberiense]PKU24047.1 transcriptional regulator [Telmatospirillum siberiense]